MKKIITLCFTLTTTLMLAQNTQYSKIIDSLLQASIKENHMPAMAAAIIKGDSIFYGTAGTISNESTEKVTAKTLFHIGSNTKAFTSFLAFQQIEEEKLSLETPFFALFPELKTDKNSAYHSITLKDLLSHNAQVQPFTAGEEFLSLKISAKTAEAKRIEFAQQVLAKPTTEKGTYSNAGYVLAAMMIENTAKKSYENLLEDFMKQQNWEYSFGFPNKKNLNNAWGHWVENNKLIALPPTHSYKLEDFMLSAGDLSMNIVDYAKWLQMHLKGFHTETGILKSENFKKMHFGIDNYGYGWGNAVQGTQKLSFHDGSTGTFYTHAILIPENQLGITIFANAADEKHVEAVYKMQQQLIAYFKKIANSNQNKH
ncbi:serine hydrolase domain-containing protein [Paenimyroides aestuarii]|uniref:Beta-lactamase family protein n=1 Tax=Paenimyroides aestuarii TaxID=2968490 RepID=A0ABY5NPE6_9FLAO|nr:serine hydrolase domain-containing protein [Paenimyroides aestuarii]UUV20424.1 beta-lactamase family protein [Paenimyroides aestuarii]